MKRESADRKRHLEVLRGSLPAEGLGARGLERMARNPKCQRLRALTIAGVRPVTAAEHVYGEKVPEGRSPFALAQGNRFERRLFRNAANELVELYVKNGRFTIGAQVVDMAIVAPGKKREALDRRYHATLAILRRRLEGDPTAPAIVVKPRLRVSVLDDAYDVEPDYLVSAEDGQYEPGEIKSYPDRAGKTDPVDVRSACRQAAVGVVALRQALAALGQVDPTRLVRSHGDLVLRVPGSTLATLRPMTLKGEVDSLERALDAAPRGLAELVGMLPDGASLADPEALDSIPAWYCSSCKEHCALAPICRRQALEAGDPVVLGDRAREQLAAAGTLPRAIELMDGAAPVSEAEARLAKQLTVARAAYEQALPHVH